MTDFKTPAQARTALELDSPVALANSATQPGDLGSAAAENVATILANPAFNLSGRNLFRFRGSNELASWDHSCWSD